MGFTHVYDYVDGKVDWMSAGLPTEGTNAQRPRAGGIARADVPTCRLDETLGDVRKRTERAGWNACVAVNDERIVLGLLRARGLAGEPGLLVEQAMRPGPSTYRPYEAAQEVATSLAERDLDSCPITTSDGRLIGLLRREDAERAVRESGESTA